jgi:IclR family KDG regulon transcriptional repressor
MDKTLLKGLQVLEAVANTDGGARTINDLAAHVGLTRSNTHRTLQTLMHAGFVERDPTDGHYRGTLKMFALGIRQLGEPDIRTIAPAFMSTLVQEAGETAHLGVLDGIDVVYIDKIDCLRPIQAYVLIGSRVPAYLVASGKVLLAAQGRSYVANLSSQLSRFAPTAVVDCEALKLQLAKVARVGYATNRGEWREGVCGLAAPVFNRFERPVAALGIAGPMDRLSVNRMKELAPRVVQVAAQLSKALGYAKKFGESLR